MVLVGADRFRELTCPRCDSVFNTRVPGKKWCTPECRQLSLPVRAFPPKTKEQRRGRYGSRYRRLRLQVIAEESYCWLCGYQVDKLRRHPDPFSPSLDHVIPLSLGGESHDRTNCRLAHLRCNRLRANQSR